MCTYWNAFQRPSLVKKDKNLWTVVRWLVTRWEATKEQSVRKRKSSQIWTGKYCQREEVRNATCKTRKLNVINYVTDIKVYFKTGSQLLYSLIYKTIKQDKFCTMQKRYCINYYIMIKLDSCTKAAHANGGTHLLKT